MGNDVLSKRTLRKARVIGILGSHLLCALRATWRVRVLGKEWEQECVQSSRGFIYAFWHGGLFALTPCFSGRGIAVLVSLNRDGEYITQTIHRMGFSTVRGSTSRGGLRALLEMARLGKRGRALAFTPDGPRGPRAKAQSGLLIVAQRARIPILPLAVCAWPRKLLSSWDRMLLPAPFARVVVGLGRPIHIPSDLTPAETVARWTGPVESAINETTALTEREMLRWGGKDGSA